MNKIIPREYQQSAIDAGLSFFNSPRTQRPQLLVAPTAAGKSIMVAMIAAGLQGRVLVLQPSVELLQQNFEKYRCVSDGAAIFSASAKSKEIGRVTFATIGSIVNVPHLFETFNYLIIDEAHLYPPSNDSMFGKFRKANPTLKILGLTATPFRLKSYMSGSKLIMMHSGGNIYTGGYCKIIQIQEIADNYWCPLRYVMDTGSQSVLKVNTSGAEYTEESVMQYGQKMEGKIIEWLEKCDGFSKIVFVPTIDQANALAKITPKSASVSSKTPKLDRERILEMFKAGKIETVFNVNLLGVGFDFPGLRMVFDAVPTMSLARYYQKIGRLTRIHPGKKNAGVVDFAGNYRRFGRIEDLKIEQVRGSYHVFSKGRQLTGVLLDAESYNDVPTEHLPDPLFCDFAITFGVHKGKKISEVPEEYLIWACDNVKNNTETLKNIKLYLNKQINQYAGR